MALLFPRPTFVGLFLKDFIMTIILYENSFVTVETADLYFKNRPNSEGWQDLPNLKKEQALIFATMKVNNFNFVGNKKSSYQKLEFPRDFSPELPADIQNAVMEEAFAILFPSTHDQNRQNGVSAVTLGNTSVHYFDRNNLGVLLSKEAYNFVLKWTVKNYEIR